MNLKKPRLAFLVSGSGTNMQNLVREIREGRLHAEPLLVISDQPQAKALERARELGVEALTVDRKKFLLKSNFEDELIWQIESHKIDYIILAGFMRILSSDFVLRYEGRIVNIHPAYLPDFPGAHGIRDAFEAKAKETGVTVHFVDAGVDTGPVILQKKVPIFPEDTLETLEARIHQFEYELYPEALRKVFSGEVKHRRTTKL